MHLKTLSAAVVALIADDGGRIKILLQRRQNTGFADGMWDLSCSGHVEEGESILKTAARESKEELGVEINYNDLNFFALIHKYDKGVVYYNAYFFADKFKGVPKIMENKCSELKWFYLDELPEDLLEDRKLALKNILNGAKYYDFGWE